MNHWTTKLTERIRFRTFAGLALLLTGIILYGFLYDEVLEETVDVKLFELADETIRSAKTVEDPVKTQQERERAEAEVPPSYQFHDEIAGNQAAVVDSFFEYVIDVKAAEPKDGEERNAADMLTELRGNLELLETGQAELRISDDGLRSLLAQSGTKLTEIQEILTDLVDSTLQEPIREEGLTEVRDGVEQVIRNHSGIPAAAREAAVTVGRFGIVPTETLNKDLTAAQKEQARQSVEPTRILQGQVLVQEGQVIDKEVYRQLELAGLTEQQTDTKPLLGLLFFVLIVLFILLFIIQRSRETEADKRIFLMVLVAVLLLSFAIMELVSAAEMDFGVTVAFLFPVGLAGMITRLLTTERLAVFITVVNAAGAAIMLQESYATTLQMDIALYILLGGLASVYVTARDDRGARLLQKSLLVSGVNMLFIGFYLLVDSSQYALNEVAYYLAAAFGSGLLSGALTVGLLPLFESVFGLLSTLRLVELSNPNHPLLRRILTETPGTYHHSVMVANLADAACVEIGANGLLARVGSYYHDIGKTRHPAFFIENQVNMRNPHDSLPPEKSRDIILNHTKDGAETLKKHKMPQEIVDIAAQHHGTSLLKFFYHKAKEQNPGIGEEMYRYAGPKPQTREAAIISIADSVEAAVRSMKEPTPEKISNLVDAITEDKVKDGQFDDCSLTMKELKTVKRVLCETLNGFFHSRIEYPKD